MAFDDENRDKMTVSHNNETELEQYGVWVKVGPEEISAEEDIIDDEFELHDLNHEENEAIGSELTDEEEELLGELEEDIDTDLDNDSLFLDEPPVEEPEGLKEGTQKEDTPEDSNEPEVEDIDIDEIEDLPELSEFDEPESAEALSDTKATLSSDFEEDEGSMDLDIDEDLLLGTDDLDDLDDLDVDGLIEEDLSELESETSAASEPSAAVSSFGGNVPVEAASPVDEEIEDINLADLENDYDDTLETLDQLPDLEEAESDELSDFDDLQALEDELEDDTEHVDLSALSPAEKTAPDSQSAQVLSKIEQELLSIKNELSSLKEELSSLKASGGTSGGAIVSQTKGESTEDGSSDISDDSGFFDEDEDETIALTGDELDNILNTANFTEENGTEELIPEEVDDESIDLSLDSFSEDLSSDLESTEDYLKDSGDEKTPDTKSEDEELLDLPELEDVSEEDFPEPMSPTEEGMLLDRADMISSVDQEEPIETSASAEESEVELDEEAQPEEAEEEAEELDLSGLEELEAETQPEEVEEEAEELDLSGLEELEAEAEPEEAEDEAEELDLSGLEELEAEAQPEEAEEDLSTEDITDFDIDESEIISVDIDGIESDKPEPEDKEVSSEFGDDILDELEIDIPDEELSALGVSEEPEEGASESTEARETEEDSHEPEIVSEEEEILFDDDETPDSYDDSSGDLKNPGMRDEEAESGSIETIPEGLKGEIKSVLSYMDQLLESLPEEKIQEFANSDHFDVYKRLFDELGLNA